MTSVDRDLRMGALPLFAHAEDGHARARDSRVSRRILLADAGAVLAFGGFSEAEMSNGSAPVSLAGAAPDARLAAARAAVERIIDQVRAALPDAAAQFGLVVRLRARTEHLKRVLASYSNQARAAAT